MWFVFNDFHTLCWGNFYEHSGLLPPLLGRGPFMGTGTFEMHKMPHGERQISNNVSCPGIPTRPHPRPIPHYSPAVRSLVVTSEPHPRPIPHYSPAVRSLVVTSEPHPRPIPHYSPAVRSLVVTSEPHPRPIPHCSNRHIIGRHLWATSKTHPMLLQLPYHW